MPPMLLINDIRRQNEANRADIDAAIRRVLDRGQYILGPEVQAFEEEFAEYCGVAHCVTVGNGTDALELALRAAGVRAGDRVATVANAGMYATTAILRNEANPVFVDVDPESMLMAEAGLASAPRVKAAVVTHLYGRMADVPSLLACCGAPMIEDCAQAHGARLHGRAAGSWGLAGCFSFYPTKNLGALGDAGAITTNDSALAETLRSLRQYGWRTKYVSEIPGGRNSRMDELQAGVLRAKLPHLNDWNKRRRAIASGYDTAFGVNRTRGAEDVAHLYVVRRRDREAVRQRLGEAGIASDVHYPIPDHRQPCLRMNVNLPVTEALSDEVLTLPLFPEMTDEEIATVIRTVQDETGEDQSESYLP